MRASRGWSRVLAAVVLLLANVVIFATDGSVATAHAPHDDVSDIAVSPSFARDETVFAIVRTKLMRSTDGGITWREIVQGLGDETEKLGRVAIAPSNARIMYLSTGTSGMYRSDDRGDSWTLRNNGLLSLAFSQIAISPRSPGVVLAGGTSRGMYRSTDGGRLWEPTGFTGRVTAMTFLADGSRAVIGTAAGEVLVSDDDGATWVVVLDAARNEPVTAITAGPDRKSTETLLVAKGTGTLVRSTNGGSSFLPARGKGLPAEAVQSLEFSPGFANDDTVWASARNTGAYVSDDGGETFSARTIGLTKDPQADEVGVPMFRTVAVTPDQSAMFLGGFDGMFRSTDDGDHWTPVETLADYIVGLAVSPAFADDETVVVTSYVKGAFVSNDGGDRWRSANSGLMVEMLAAGNEFAPLRRLHNVVFSPDYAQDETIFSASWVRLLKSTNRGRSWTEIDIGPRPTGPLLRQFVLAPSPAFASDQVLYAATRQGEIFRSNAAGDSRTWVQVGLLDGRVRSLVLSPNFPVDQVLYAGTVNGVFKSADGGASWTDSGVQLASDARGLETDAAALLAISPGYGTDGTVFAGTDSGLHVSRDFGGSWSEVTTSPLSNSSQIEGVAVSPDYANDRTVLVSARRDGLLRSTNSGATFEPLGADLLEDNRVIADFSNPTSEPIQFSPAYATDNTVFAYAQTDVLRSTDEGDTWDVLELATAQEVLDGLDFEDGGHAGAEPPDDKEWFETPIGNLSMRRVLAAGVVGLLGFGALWIVGFGGRKTSVRVLALRLGGALLVFAIALLILAD